MLVFIFLKKHNMLEKKIIYKQSYEIANQNLFIHVI
jgi:hypothetical protein